MKIVNKMGEELIVMCVYMIGEVQKLSFEIEKNSVKILVKKFENTRKIRLWHIFD